MLKIGFSSASCPAWDLETIITNASSFGYDGFELRGLQGELHLPLVPELARHPDHIRERCLKAKVELICLGSSVTLDTKSKRKLAEQKVILTEYIELAAKLGCQQVRLFAGEVQRLDNCERGLTRIVDALHSMIPIASRRGVTLLVENGGDFNGSDDMWFIADAVSHPNVQICWNQCNALTIMERATNSIPRLGSKIGMVHLCDASYDTGGTLLSYQPLGQGDAQVARQIELLRGIMYNRYVVFDWPKLWTPTLASPDIALPLAAEFLKQQREHKQVILSAYKNDKQAPRLGKQLA